MSDPSNELADFDELKFSREQGFFDKSLGIRILIGLAFVLVLFVILHFREVRIEVLEVNTIAPNYIVAQVDFEFFDEEGTIIAKQEAVRNVGKIYKISDKEVRNRRIEFENAIAIDEFWRDKIQDLSVEQVYRGIDSLERVLKQLRLSDPRTLQKIKQAKLPSEGYRVYTPADASEPVIFSQRIWEYVKREAFPEDEYPQEVVALLMSYFQGQGWMLEEDIPSERTLRQRIQADVPEKYTHVDAGSRIIDQGEKVTTRHIAQLQAMKKVLSERRNLSYPMPLLGSLILTLILTAVCLAYLRINHPLILLSNRKLFLLVTITVLTLLLAKVSEYFLLTSQSNLLELIHYPLFVPFAAILLCSLMTPGIATFASGFLTVVLMMTLAFDQREFMIINLAAAFVAILSARTLKRRKEVFVVCGKAWLACVAVILSMHLYSQTHWSVGLAADLISSGVFMLLTAVLVVGLLPLLESGFRIMTDVSLMEYMDPNNDLLRRLSIEAPGTYQHSVVVGNLAEAAAIAIGANGLFCRVATLYHDVGKMATPQYFTENQQQGMNIHQLLTPQESAQVIMAHVSEGVSLGRKAGLPEQFIDIIKEHHGTTLVYFFYRKQVEKMDGDASKVDERDFRYAGPKPRSKESGIIMIADTLEAASRSLETVDESSVNEMANRLLRDKIDDGQFNHCLLTCEEMAVVKATLVKTLVAYRHSRVKYPKRAEQEEKEKNKRKKR